MKVRESGMPEPGVWDSYFKPEAIFRALGIGHECGDIVEFGCGYGTFTVAAARLAKGTVYALDIDPAMVETARRCVVAAGVDNVSFSVRDFVADGSGRPDGSAECVLLFNILHTEAPVALLREAYRNLGEGGRVAIIHWVYDPDTPRGPPMAIRPRPEQCRQWAEEAGLLPGPLIQLPPYHYGFIATRLGSDPTP
jgi:SAM-dependent methyltransferase